MKTHARNVQNVLLLFGFLFISAGTFSQDKGGKRGEKIKQLKVAYITEQLNLTVAESEKFWPIYNEMEQKLKSNRKENKKVIDDISQNVETFTEEDFKKNMNKLFENDLSQTTIKKEYFTKIAGAIGYKKTTKLLKIEKEFKQKLLKELKKRREEKQGPKK